MTKLEVWIDGACEPGGTASYGVVVKSNGVTIFTNSTVVDSGPEMSNNVAEYSSLIDLSSGIFNMPIIAKATAYSDSSLLVNQMTGYRRARRGL